jgi:hypothetical protein
MIDSNLSAEKFFWNILAGMMGFPIFDGGIGGGVASDRRSWRPFSVPEGVGGVVRSFESLQGFTSIQYQFLGELKLDLNRLEAFSKGRKSRKVGRGWGENDTIMKKGLTLTWLTP